MKTQIHSRPPPPLSFKPSFFCICEKRSLCSWRSPLCVCDSESLLPRWIILCSIVNLKRNCLRGQAFCVCQTKISKVKPFVCARVCVCVCKTKTGRLYHLSGACCVSLQVTGSLSSLAYDGPRLPREKERCTPSCTSARSTKRRGNESRRGRLTTVLMRWCVVWNLSPAQSPMDSNTNRLDVLQRVVNSLCLAEFVRHASASFHTQDNQVMLLNKDQLFHLFNQVMFLSQDQLFPLFNQVMLLSQDQLFPLFNQVMLLSQDQLFPSFVANPFPQYRCKQWVHVCLLWLVLY